MELIGYILSGLVFSSATSYAISSLERIGSFEELRADGNNSEGFQQQWFVQKFDHFDPTNTKTWRQRYVENQKWYNNSGNNPVFLMITGETGMTSQFDQAQWMEWARVQGALCFQLEHRFYGYSYPTNDMSVASLRYLSSEQALADIANFVQGMNAEHNLTSQNKWVAFGGSYAGNLVAWARLKYPHLIYAGVSSSGPVLAQVDFKGFREVHKYILANISLSCADNVHQFAIDVQNNLRTPEGLEYLQNKFNTCSPLDVTNKNDLSYFADRIYGIVVAETACGFNSTENLMNQVAKAYNESCLHVSYYDAVVTGILGDTINFNFNRPWNYQLCTEFGFGFTSGSDDAFFGALIDIEYYTAKCRVFGQKFNSALMEEGVARSNMMYGGLDINVTRVVFVYGTYDPWHANGKLIPSNDESPVIMIEGGHHAEDMLPASENDSPSMASAKIQIGDLISTWLS